MSYTPTEWKTGDVVTSEKLNKVENGLAAIPDSEDTLTVIVRVNPTAEILGTLEDAIDESTHGTRLQPEVISCSKTLDEIYSAVSEGKCVTVMILEEHNFASVDYIGYDSVCTRPCNYVNVASTGAEIYGDANEGFKICIIISSDETTPVTVTYYVN